MNEINNFYNTFPILTSSFLLSIFVFIVLRIYRSIQSINPVINSINNLNQDIKSIIDYLQAYQKYNNATVNQFRNTNDSQFDYLFKELKRVFALQNLEFKTDIQDLKELNKPLLDAKNEEFDKADKEFILHFKNVQK